ncbi:MAG TPA: ribosome maturation factor RimP [Pyrinomonadaceae bacterium]|nr:ribosome maturation factor RimP [Pyrinomonadaceae bacterium]
MSSNSIEEQLQAIAKRIADENKLELVHCEIVGSKRNQTVRVFIDKEGGVTIEDCSNFSRNLEAVLDADDLIPTAYVLEVSSPGLERELYSLQDFIKFSGSLAKVKTNQPINGQKNFSGRIVSVKGEEIIFSDKTNGEVSFPYNTVAKANLEIDLEEELKGKK